MITFHEPDWVRFTIILSFLYFLQVARVIANYTLGAGLLGEIALGIIYGPLANLLQDDWDSTFLILGYLGLILIVFEGGLDFDPALFLSTFPLATSTAVVGVLLPIAFTFALFHAFSYPPITAFTAGAALASTSLGTTFFVLKAQSSALDLATTRVGSALVAAALIDDIISLVLLSVITNLAEGQGGPLNWVIGRPVVASFALATGATFVTFWVAQPIYRKWLERFVVKHGTNVYLAMGLVSLSAFLSIAYYAGTTMLLGAFLAGIFVTSLPSPPDDAEDKGEDSHFPSPVSKVYHDLISPLQDHIFCPLFFASIGYTIPFLSMFKPKIIWRGVLYSVLMLLGKLLAGSCILLADCVTISFSSFTPSSTLSNAHDSSLPHVKETSNNTSSTPEENTKYLNNPSIRPLSTNTSRGRTYPINFHSPSSLSSSLLSSLFLGSALIARGEIGVLVLQVAHSASSSSSVAGSTMTREVLSDEPYLVALWAVGLCTILGPVGFGWIVRRRGEFIVTGK